MQIAVISALADGPIRVAELAADLGSVDGAVRRLEELGVVTVERRRRFRDIEVRERPAPMHSRLSDGQTQALHAITGARAAAGVVVLEGVTGSGKTEVYLQAIESALETCGSAIVLVPEISLTPQTVGRFRSRFGDLVAVLHSRLSAGERYDQWDRIRTGEARVIVGARSALFAPASDLRLVVIDEEHESSYKQGSSPRYVSRDTAAKLCGTVGATLVLGSATPALETLAMCERGAWTLVRMPERVAGGSMPDVTVVDMAAEFAAGHRSMFSRELLAALQAVREAGDKAVLLLNRRGFASFVLCRECGYVPQCDNCSVSMTYHDVGSRLACHHCGAVRALPATCPECGGPYLRQFGAGTQRVESELGVHLPGWNCVRMDADTTRTKGGHERALAAFESLDTGVLIGTQMIAKGLDYPDVTLVGVISADTTLNLPDFRAGERTYQLLEQVAGRAGRGPKGGRVIVQTYWPDHPAVLAVAEHDAARFQVQELEMRQALSYPPFGRLANIIVRGRDGAAVARSATDFATRLRSAIPDAWVLLGPGPAPISRIKGVHRWHLLMKAPVDAEISKPVRDALRRYSAEEGVLVGIDVDPVDLL